MDLRYTASFLLLFGPLVLLAQPTLPSGNSSFAPGESYILHIDSWFAPPALGEANTTWDHSDFVVQNTMTDAYYPPNTGGGIPSATVAENIGTNAYAYYRATASAFEQLGLIMPSATLNCTADAITVISYPFTFNTQVNDTYDCYGTSSGEAFDRNDGSIDLLGASYGTLILPYGTFTNVLMVDIEQHHSDVFASDPDFPIDYNAFTQMFLKVGVKQPLLANYEAYSVPGPYNAFSRMLDESAIGVEEASLHAIGVDLIPNPATDRVEILFGVAAGKRLTIELIDLTGKTLLSINRSTMVNAVQREILDLDALPAGAYTVRIVDETGAMGAKRLVKN